MVLAVFYDEARYGTVREEREEVVDGLTGKLVDSGTWSLISNSCSGKATTPKPPTKPKDPPSEPSKPPTSVPPAGTSIVYKLQNDLICDSSHPQYSSGAGSNDLKNYIIGKYRSWGGSGNDLYRCVEFSGYLFWQRPEYLSMSRSEFDKIWEESALASYNEAKNVAYSSCLATVKSPLSIKKYPELAYFKSVRFEKLNQCRVNY